MIRHHLIALSKPLKSGICPSSSHLQILPASHKRYYSNVSIRAHNSLTGRIDELKPRGVHSPPNDSNATPHVAPGIDALTWYICGPTVYDVGHLGHARTYVCFDMINRIMSDYFRVPLIVSMGVTDVDDKIINRANELGVPWLLLSRHYEASFMHDLDCLGVRRPAVSLRVTEHMPAITDYIQQIIDRGLAYTAEDGVYFDVMAFVEQGHSYGKLQFNDLAAARRHLDEGPAAPGASAADRGFKRHRADFALWKSSRAGEPSWPSSWGAGRPGWHIECSAMTAAALGAGVDVHAGGVDLRFPHHCNEIAQGEARFGWGGAGVGEWCPAWLHTGHLHIAGCKMSKSLKNFISIQDMFAEGFTADEFRMLCATSHYRATLDYAPAKLTAARGHLRAVHNFAATVARALSPDGVSRSAQREHERAHLAQAFQAAVAGGATEWSAAPLAMDDGARALLGTVGATQTAVRAALCDDFDTPRALQAGQLLMSACSAYLHACRARGRAPNADVCTYALDEVLGVYTTLGFAFPAAYAERPHGQSVSADAEAALPAVSALARLRAEMRAGAVASGLKKADKKRFDLALARVAAAAPDEAQELRDALTAPREKLERLTGSLLSRCDELRDETVRALGYALSDTASAGGTGDQFHLRPLREDEKAAPADDKANK